MKYYKIYRLSGVKVFYGALTIPMLCVGSNFSLEGLKISFAVGVVVLFVFAGSTVLGVNITNCYLYLRFFIWS